MKKRILSFISIAVYTAVMCGFCFIPAKNHVKPEEVKPAAVARTLNNSDYMLLARIISAEARGEPYEGQVAVGAVILNRIDHPSFPDTMSGVIYQPLAFSCVDDGQINEPVADSAYKAATDALNGWDPSGGAIYYYNPVTATSKWIRSREIIKQIGKHVFCL